MKRVKPPIKVGDTYGKWTVIGNTKEHGFKWKCICGCGDIKFLSGESLSWGRSTQCQSCRRKETAQDAAARMWYTVVYGAKLRDLEVSVTKEQVVALLTDQGNTCALSGQPIGLSRNRTDNTASLDRIDSNKGYVPGNIQWVHKDVNMMKRVYGNEYFIRICNLVAETHPR